MTIEALTITPRAGAPEWEVRNVRAHNRAVAAYIDDERGDLRRVERGILSLLDGIAQYSGSCAEHADPLSGEAIYAIVESFTLLLNYDVGRLDPGTLDGAARNIVRAWGVNPNTGEWEGNE